MVPLVAVLLAIATTTTALTLPPPHRLRVDQRLLSDGVLDATIAPVFSFEVPLSVADSAHRAADVSAYRIVVLQRGASGSSTTVWDSGEVPLVPTSSRDPAAPALESIPFGGTPLAFDTDFTLVIQYMVFQSLFFWFWFFAELVVLSLSISLLYFLTLSGEFAIRCGVFKHTRK